MEMVFYLIMYYCFKMHDMVVLACVHYSTADFQLHQISVCMCALSRLAIPAL